MDIRGLFTRKKPVAKGKRVKAADNDPGSAYLAREQETSTWSAVCLPLSGVFLLALGIALIVVAIVADVTDLIIVGVIFLLGSVIFFLMMFCSICRPKFRRHRQVGSYEKFQTPESAVSRVPDATDYSVVRTANDDLKQARNQPRPSISQLYGNRQTPSSHAPSPTTITDVSMNPGDDTPPPPRLALPGDPHDPNRPTFSRTVHTPQPANEAVSELELL